MKIEYKQVGVAGVSAVEDEGDGVISAFVSVTGLEDNVKDVIEPGAYKKTLAKRHPKGVWGHQWLTPTSKTLSAEELLPGHEDLPKELSNGEPWPKEAGALRIKMQFNLKTQRGREAYEDVRFFDNQQEWSIGYAVPTGGATKNLKTGVRHIKELELYEYSPVLFGAMTHARTSSIKDAQFALKTLFGEDVKQWEQKLIEFKAEHGVAVVTETGDGRDDDGSDFEGDEDTEDESFTDEENADDVDDEYDEDEEDESEDEDDEEEEKLSPEAIRLTIKTLEALLASTEGEETNSAPGWTEKGYIAYIEARAVGYKSVREAVKAAGNKLGIDLRDLQRIAGKLDTALQGDDRDAWEKAGNELLDGLEELAEELDDSELDSIKIISRVMSDKMGTYVTPEEDDDEEDEDEEEKAFWVDEQGKEFKMAPYEGRVIGMPNDISTLSAGADRMRAFVGGLDGELLSALEDYVSGVKDDPELSEIIESELVDRETLGLLEKTGAKRRRLRRLPGTEEMGEGSSTRAFRKGPKRGQVGRGGGSQRQRAEGRGASNTRGKEPTGGLNPLKTSAMPKRAGKTDAPARQEQHGKYSAERMAKLGAKGHAFRNKNGEWSYPIENDEDLQRAIKAFGRSASEDKEKLKSYIKARAKELGKEDLIPDNWTEEKTGVIDLSEVKSLQDFLANIE